MRDAFLQNLHIKRGGHKSAFDLGVLGVTSLRSAESSLDRIDTLITEARNLDIGTDLGGLRSQTLADVGLELLSDGLGGELDIIPDIGVPSHPCQHSVQYRHSSHQHMPVSRSDVRDRKLESIKRVAVFLIEGPSYRLVELLDGDQSLLGDVTHDRVDDLALVVTLLATNDILGGDTTLGQIDITLLLVDAENDDDLVAANTNQLLDGTNTASGKLREEDHAVDVVVLQKLDIGAHIGDLTWGSALTHSHAHAHHRDPSVSYLLDVDHNEGVDLGILLLVETAVGERHLGGWCLFPGGANGGISGVGGGVERGRVMLSTRFATMGEMVELVVWRE